MKRKDKYKDTHKDVCNLRDSKGVIIYSFEVTCCNFCDAQIPPDVFQIPCDNCYSKSDWYKTNEC